MCAERRIARQVRVVAARHGFSRRVRGRNALGSRADLLRPSQASGGIDDKPASLPDAPWEPLRDEHRGNNQHEPGRRV